MIGDWLWTTWTEAWLAVVSAIAILVALIAVIRVVGLRSLSKMSSFDFAVTVAMGSIVAGVSSSSTSLVHGVIAVATLLGAQATIAVLRRRTRLSDVVDNQPMFLMWEGEFVEASMASGRVTRSDVVAKLREANVLDRSQVRAVVLETTGDVSVLHGDEPLDDLVLEGIAPLS
ncbi:DUF421 domain-containing protein [Ilumatobacter sp.]|uniref:DUF421 domain-containing protein n=1 Tax=Ilumatobacter sp. TaxID=1967498 RepID=UPI003B52AE3C